MSDNGDILSPKYAPETIAPAVIADGNPSAAPTPISATPMEPAVDHDDPVANDTILQSKQDVTKKIFGLITLIP